MMQTRAPQEHAAQIVEAAPSRATVHDGRSWQWASLARRSTEPPPTPLDVLADKCREHSLSAVALVLGLHKTTITSYVATGRGHRGTKVLVETRIGALAGLDDVVDVNRGKASK